LQLEGRHILGNYSREGSLRGAKNTKNRSVKIKIKRVYEEANKDDGKRILVDRLWPRGLPKAKAKVDLWLKDVSPSTELRKWFGHEPSRWEEFKRRYRTELEKNNKQLADLKQFTKTAAVTLVYSAKDEQHNGAVVLKEFLERG
jgi:uncharacterized protein YeaO (DUF488 family)